MKIYVLRLAIVALLVIGCLGAPSLQAQFPSWDSVYFDPISIYYPGQPDTGKIKAEMYWAHPPEPYSLPAALFTAWITYAYPVYCDSFVINPALLDTMYNDGLIIDNQNGEFAIGLHYYEGVGGPTFPPGNRKIGDIYFSVLDTGYVKLDSLYAPMINLPGVGFWLEGLFFADSFQISNPGDFNNDQMAGNITDAVFLVQYIFSVNPEETPVPFADANSDCLTNITDAVYLIDYIFNGGAAAGAGCQFM